METFRILLPIIISLLILPIITSASQSTQVESKIFLSPFYLNSMSSGSMYYFNLSIDPPDGFSKTVSAIISFDVHMTPSVNFTLLVNSQRCNTQFYYISTTFASAGQERISFDCSNIITREGLYNVSIRPIGASTGSLSGWIDLSYINSPFGEMKIGGTEYSIGDIGTTFLQLKDSNGFPVINGSCYIDIFYPNIGNLSHPQWIYNAPMIYKPDSDGLFYYDFTAPNIQGIYMLAGSCQYDYLPVFLYTADSVNQSTREVVRGTYEGDTIVLNSREDGLYTRCTSATPVPQSCVANYSFLLYDSVIESNVSKIDIYYMGESTILGSTMKMSIYNYSNGNFYDLPNTVTFTGLATPTAPSGLNDLLSNSISSNVGDFIRNKRITIRLNTTGSSAFKNWNNWLTLRVLTAEGVVVDVKGSGELHIKNLPSEIWNYPSRNLTDYNQSLMWSYLNQINISTYNLTNLIQSTNNSLYSFIYQVNNSIHSRMNDINVSISNSIYNVNSNINSVNASIYNLLLSINNSISSRFSLVEGLISNVNQTVIDKYNSLYNLINSINSSLSGQMSGYNSSLSNLIYSIDSQLSSIYSLGIQINGTVTNIYLNVNTTAVENLINQVNQTLYAKINESETATYAVNQSIMDKLALIQSDLSSIQSLASEINGTTHQTHIDLLSINQSLANAIMQVNQSISNELYGIRNQLQNISGDIAQVMLLIGDVNQSLTDRLYDIQVGINDLSGLINLTNATIMNKLFKMQDEIKSVNDTILSSNETIMTELTGIHGDLYLINSSIIATLLLLTNATVNISVSQTSLFNDLVALWGDQIAPSYAAAGFTGFLPSAYAADDSQYVCLDNQTLRQSKNITLDTPDGLKNYVRTIDTQCTYGCSNNTCIMPDYTLFIILFIAIIIMYLIYRHWFADRG